jgi:hypothetical protein
MKVSLVWFLFRDGSCSMRKGWFSALTALAIGSVLLECKPAAPLRLQFAYVANFCSNLVSAYSVGSNGALTPVPGFPFAGGIIRMHWQWIPKPGLSTWQTSRGN